MHMHLGLNGFSLMRFLQHAVPYTCLLYTSDAADEEDSVDLGGRRIIKKERPSTPWFVF